jgi:hypothetical protein
MTNIRIVRLIVKSATEIEITFTHNVNTSISVENFTITSLNGSVPSVEIISISIENKIVTLYTRPMVGRAYYKLIVASTSLQQFRGARNEILLEDGATNQVYFIGPEEENDIRDIILEDLPKIYDKESGSLIYKAIDTSATEILKATHRAGEVHSANYVSITVENESITRGAGSYDRFENEGVFQILRVGIEEEGTTSQGTITFSEFPSNPVSLQQIYIEEEEVSNISNSANSFSGLTINLSKKPIIKVSAIRLERDSVAYPYDIVQYRYGILTSKYDSDHSYSLVDLQSNQIKLSNAAIGPNFPYPQSGDKIYVEYYYKKIGRNVSSESVEIYKNVVTIRESAPAVSTSFFLGNAPIVDSNGNVPSLNGIEWLDPAQNYNSDVKHPAFTTEISYSTINFPKNVGEWSCNYITGQVFVYGIDDSGTDGTTTIPPVANYSSKYTFQEGLDYNFFADLDEIASLPDGSLRGNPGIISFQYEDTFAKDTDFKFNSHVEVINERINNNLIEDIGVYTQNGPVNEVFRIYNETTGEIYTPTRINDNKIYFSSVNAPRTKSILREAVRFEQSLQSQLLITDILTIVGKSFVAFQIELEDVNIASATGNFIGASFNTSLFFSDIEVFEREFYYDSNVDISINLPRLQKIGDYMVDYINGIVYVAVESNASTNIGDASYRKAVIKTRYSHIIRVSDIYRSASISATHTKIFNVSNVGDTTVTVSNIDSIGETILTSGSPITVAAGDLSIEVSNDIFKLLHIFQITDLKVNASPIDFSSNATISSSNPNIINLSSSGVPVFDDNDGYSLDVQVAGTRQFITAERISSFVTSGLMELVSVVSVVDENTGDNYFSHGNDGYIDAVTNRIYLPSTADAYGRTVNATYNVKLKGGAAVLVASLTGNMYIDYTYTQDELLISYEYGDNVLDWSISDSLNEGDTYYVTYRYGSLRNSLRDNFGVLSGIEELSTIPEELDREIYRSAIKGSLQSFPKGPTIPAIKQLVEAFTQIEPNITESVFLEWILGRDNLNLVQMKLDANNDDELPEYAIGKFGNGLLLNKSGQSAIIPTTSNIRFAEGTWEAFIIPNWNGIDNDAILTFDIKFDGTYRVDKIFIGSTNINPSSVPFAVDKNDLTVIGRPSKLHQETGYFIWFDTSFNQWRIRARGPITESRLFTGNITTTGEFNDVKIASTADGYDGYDGYEITEINDTLRSTNTNIYFSFVVDGYDSLNIAYDAYDAYDGSYAGFDGIDFTSDNIHYLFDTGLEENKNRISLYKDGMGFLRFRVYDNNKRIKILSSNIKNWSRSETYHVAVSWKIGTIEMRDEMHLFIDGREVPNTYRYRGYRNVPADTLFMDTATEVLASSVSSPTLGGSDLSTTQGSNIVTSVGSNFVSAGVQVGDKFIILDNTDDGNNTRSTPYVYVKEVYGQNMLKLMDGNGYDYNTLATLTNVKFSLNPLILETVSDLNVENVLIYSIDPYSVETELYSATTADPDYEFSRDGYQDYITVYDGVPVGSSIVLRSYGLTMSRSRQYVYLWPNMQTNILNTITPPPTSISKIDITKIIVKATQIETGAFALIATVVGGHIALTLSSNLDFCQPSNSITGKKLTVSLYGSGNLDFTGLNQIVFLGNTTDGYGSDTLTFSSSSDIQLSTSRYFTSLSDIIATFTPIDLTKPAGVIEVREMLPLNKQENNGNYAEIHLSVQDQVGHNGTITVGTNELTDAYSRFGTSDIGKTFNITSPSSIAGSFTIQNVALDPSGTMRDSNTVILNTTWADSYSNIEWQVLNTSYGDSGFANGLITLEIARSGGQPFLLGTCWYEIDFPTYLTIPWDRSPESLYIGSDIFSENQANAVIDEMRILDEMSLDTGIGESLPSSGRSITTDAAAVSEFTETTQTLGLFHFNDDLSNAASFYTSFDKSFRQSENSVNPSFGQSGVFNIKQSYQVDNRAVFDNDEGTIEFWISPILDTYNDPSKRYYIDLTPEQQVTTTALSSLTVSLPVRARSVSVVELADFDTDVNYFIGGSLSSNGQVITLGQPLPANRRNVKITFVPITSSGDRFSIYKDETGKLTLFVRASETDFQITVPVYWKKNTWHRIFAGWDLNNEDNQDRLIFMVDGTESGIIRYGTGLIYGTGVHYGQPTVWGSAVAGTTVARNILSDINLLDTFNTVHIGADFTGQFTALARIDNIRFSNVLRTITYLGEQNGTMVSQGPGRLIGKDLLYTSNVNAAQPVIEDALTSLLINFNTDQTENEHLATVRSASSGIFDFFVEVIDTFELANTDLTKALIISLINRIKPAHTRAFVSFIR